MIALTLVLTAAASVLASPVSLPGRSVEGVARLPAPPPIAGVTLPMHYKERGKTYARELAEVRELGAEWVQLIVVTRQARVDSIEVPHVSDRTPSFEDVAAVFRRARDSGLRVLVTPVVLIKDAGTDDWRGTLRPRDTDAWFESYSEFVLRLARIAAATDVEAFCVGSELASLERETGYWEDLIAEVREVFPGWLTYSANWDHFASIEFWERLDFASMTAYFTLSKSSDPTLKELTAGWRHGASELQRLEDRAGLPVVFTEVGVPSLKGGAGAPWDYTRQAVVDLDLQRRAFVAFERIFVTEGRPTAPCHGFFLYDWWGAGGPSSTTYTAREKPAADVWRRLLRVYSGS
jgi:hypothetical protein